MTSNKMLNEENKRSDLVGDMLEAPSTPSIKSSSPTNHEIDKMIDSDSVSPIHNVSSTPPSPKLYSNDTLSTSLSLSSSPKFMSDKPNSDSDVSDTNPDGTLDIVCQEKNSVSVNSNPVTRQTKLNNFEISNDNGAVLDLTGKVETIMANPLHLSNGQVLSWLTKLSETDHFTTILGCRLTNPNTFRFTRTFENIVCEQRASLLYMLFLIYANDLFLLQKVKNLLRFTKFVVTHWTFVSAETVREYIHSYMQTSFQVVKVELRKKCTWGNPDH